jgi:hypothetical protein
MKVITKDIPIYSGYFRIVITKDFEKAVKKLNVKTNGLDVKNYGALVLENDFAKNGCFRYTIILPPKSSPHLIAHEAVHLVNNLFVNCGIQLDRHNDEAQAYLTGWFAKQVNKALKK